MQMSEPLIGVRRNRIHCLIYINLDHGVVRISDLSVESSEKSNFIERKASEGAQDCSPELIARASGAI